MKEHSISLNHIGENPISEGKTTVSPEVLLTIARLTALSVPGVSRMSNVLGGVNRLLKRGLGDGVRLEIQEDKVFADLYVILQSGFNIREVCHEIQQKVGRAISEMVGMQPGRINIHVEDIDYSTETINPQEA